MMPEKKQKKICSAFLFLSLVFMLGVSALPGFAADADSAVMKRWTKDNDISDKDGMQRVQVKVIYYANEYVEALVNSEAEKNLWTQDEMENYKYTLLKTLNLNDSIAFNLSLYVEGLPIYAQPFDKHITLVVGKKRYTPSDYDKRFNFKISGHRDGMVYFPRYDPKTGADILKGAKDIRLILDGSISHTLSHRGDLLWVWDITKDRSDALGAGRAMNRLEIDRLLRRIEKLNSERKGLQSKIDAIDQELSEVNARVDTLQAQ